MTGLSALAWIYRAPILLPSSMLRMIPLGLHCHGFEDFGLARGNPWALHVYGRVRDFFISGHRAYDGLRVERRLTVHSADVHHPVIDSGIAIKYVLPNGRIGLGYGICADNLIGLKGDINQ